VAWHKTAGFFRKTVVIADGHDVAADFFIPLDVDSKQEAEKDRDPAHTGGSR
jgi:hypothetical protein